MQEHPLAVARILTHGATTHARSTVTTWHPDGPRVRTFAQLGQDAARLAHALRRLGVSGDQRVATFMLNHDAHVAAYLAVPSMGAVLHTLNPRLAAEEIAWIANDATDSVVLVDATLAEDFAAVAPMLTSVRHVLVHGALTAEAEAALSDAVAGSGSGGVVIHDLEALLAETVVGEGLAGEDVTFDWPVIDERDAAAVCYTSGTTGRPRGVAYSHRSIWLQSMQLMAAEAYGLSDRHKALVVVPQFHAMAWGFPYAAFMSGASLLLPDRFAQPDQLLAMIERERPTVGAAVPAVWIPLLELADRLGSEAAKPDLSSLREVGIGGSACPPSLIEAFADRHGITVLHAWGMTETSPMGSIARPPAYAAGGAEEWSYRVSQGRLPAAVEGRIVGDDGSILPSDGVAVGELQVRGPWVTASYLGGVAPEAFDGGWLRTGDVGSLTPDGFLTLTDRVKDVIKSGGEWISSVALENALLAHPSVRDAAVIAVPDERWGERPAALVIPAEGAEVSFDTLREHLAGTFPRWQLPDHWTIVETLPRTATGKTDKKALRSSLRSRPTVQ